MTSRHAPADPPPWRLQTGRIRSGVTLLYADEQLVGLVIGVANARIAAVAPELIRAAERVAAWWQTFRVPPADPDTLTARLREGEAAITDLRAIVGRALRPRGP